MRPRAAIAIAVTLIGCAAAQHPARVAAAVVPEPSPTTLPAATRPAATRRPECGVPGTSKPIDALWRPDMAAAAAYARTRVGDIAFAVRTDGRFYGYRLDHVEWSASVVKAMLMVAYLDRPSVADRAIDAEDNTLLIPMITASNNDAADQVDEIVGDGGLDALARTVGMTHFRAVAPSWGETQITRATRRGSSCTSTATSLPVTAGTRCTCSRRSSRPSGGGSASCRSAAEPNTSRAAGATAPVCSTTRSSC